MNFTKTMFALAVGSVGIMGAMSAHAVAVNNGDVLTIDTGSISAYTQSVAGSFFVMDLNGDAKAQYSEMIALSQGTTGITIGAVGGGGNYHAGPPLPADANSGAIVDSWLFNGSTGTNYTSVGITGGSGTASLNLSGWGVNWSTVTGIPMGSGAWTLQAANPVGGWTGSISGTTNGMANFSWNGVYGSAYTLDYTATVPANDPSGFGGTKYALHLTGIVNAAPIPEASTYGMMLAGLGLVGGMVARRRKLLA